MTDGRDDWVSAHVFLACPSFGAATDQAIVDVLAPIANAQVSSGRVRRFFFIRYGELGPHLRLRMQLSNPREREAVEASVEEQLAASLPIALYGAPRGTLPAGARRSKFAPLAWIPYEPELDRYGGPRGVALAEELFFASSAFVITLLSQRPNDARETRLGLGLLATMLTVTVFGDSPDEQADIADACAAPRRRLIRANSPDAADRPARLNAVRRNVEMVGEALSSGRVPAAVEQYRVSLERTRLRLDNLIPKRMAQSRVAASYAHMTNNRLGIAPRIEGELASLMARVLVSR